MQSVHEERTSSSSPDLSAVDESTVSGLANVFSYNRRVESGSIVLDFNSTTPKEKEEELISEETEAIGKPPEAQSMSRIVGEPPTGTKIVFMGNPTFLLLWHFLQVANFCNAEDDARFWSCMLDNARIYYKCRGVLPLLVLEFQTKELGQRQQCIEQLELEEWKANEEIQGFMVDIACAEEEITGWNGTAEQEADVGSVVAQDQ